MAVVLGVGACTCGPRVGSLSRLPVRVNPDPLTFSASYVGVSNPRTLEIGNPNLSTALVTLEVPAPFSVDVDQLRVAGGSSAVVTVTFTAVTPGPVAATLHLVQEERAGALDVALIAQGLIVPACPTAAACHATTFDTDAGFCVDVSLGDGADCSGSDPCFALATCLGGRCIGTLTSCDDHDACTVDACGPAGCAHSQVSCAISDPCQVALCDPASGCSSAPVSDGTPCGSQTCSTAHVCLGGRCEVLQRPNAATDCLYTAVAAGAAESCAITRAGSVKCWGGGKWDPQLDPGFSSMISISMGPGELCGLRSDGTAVCRRDGPLPLSEPATQLDVTQWRTCALLVSGAVECTALSMADGGLSVAFDAGPVVALAQSNHGAPCVLRPDGGVECVAGLVPILPAASPLPALSTLVDVGYYLLCGTTPQARVACAGGYFRSFDAPPVGLTDFSWDAGVVMVGGGSDDPAAAFLCAATGEGDVECRHSLPVADGGVEIVWVRDAVPPPVRAITPRGLGSGLSYPGLAGHVCLLDGDGGVWCAGANGDGQLGDRSARPKGVRALSLNGPASALASSGPVRGAPVVATDAGFLWMSVASGALADAGYPFELAAPTPVAIVALAWADNGGAIAADAMGRVWESFNVFDVHRGWSMAPSAAPATAVRRSSTRFFARVLAGGRAWGLYAASAAAPTDLGPAVSISPECALRPDGGVRCDSDDDFRTQPIRVLGDDATAKQGCAGGLNGGIDCWHEIADGGLGFTPVPGVRPFPRLIAGTVYGGCAVTGQNGVQCWGSNAYGQLGRDSPSTSSAALDVSVAEPVQSIAYGTTVCVLTRSGRVLCWGANDDGQLGFEPLMHSDHFVRVEN